MSTKDTLETMEFTLFCRLHSNENGIFVTVPIYESAFDGN